MKTATQILNDFSPAYPIERFEALENILFLDIETTGFTARSSHLYIIGCAYYDGTCWNIKQWMAENTDEEKLILESFFDFASGFRCLIHFNGNNFDLPYINQKCEQLGLSYNFDSFKGVDIFRRISPYRFLLKLNNCRQKTVEQFLGISREDKYTGGELIDIYKNYCTSPDAEAEELLLLHNADDIKGMLSILPMLAYDDLITSPLKARKVQANYYKDMNGNTKKELVIYASIDSAVPVAINASSDGCYFRCEDNAAVIRVPIYEEELKYFYSNYKDYYYLPAEDVALHKSVSSFVDKDYRIPATAANCYTRKQSSYLPQWGNVFSPFYKRDYKSKQLYFELTDEFKKDREAFSVYATHILAMIASTF